jgi:hypothetical protein
MEKIETLELLEIKSLCKKYGIGVIGDKKTLIKNLKYYLDPVQDVLNTHQGRKLPQGKTIVGVKVSEKERINRILKSKGSFMYYSLGYQYYLVDKDLV